jgi:chemotaxis protein MotB
LAISSRRRRRPGIDIWPGFVDALTQLVMIIIFVLLVFTAGQFYLSNALTGRDEALAKLNQRINALSDLLALEKKSSADLQLQLGTLSDQLTVSKAELAKAQAALAQANTETAQAKQDLAAQQAQLQKQLSDETTRRKAAEEDIAQRDEQIRSGQSAIERLNEQLAALQKQLGEISAALDLSETKNKQADVQIADLGRRLNAALATKVAELAGYRSEFFGRLRQLLGDRADIRVVGDRFMFQSEVLFDLASADLTPEAMDELTVLANALKEISAKIPPDVNWVLQVEGHTDKRPIVTPQFPSNWELSTARAVSVVKFLISQGIPANRLSAAGFGEFQPVDPGDSPEAFKHNRRIELKLTSR